MSNYKNNWVTRTLRLTGAIIEVSSGSFSTMDLERIIPFRYTLIEYPSDKVFPAAYNDKEGYP
jgi:hypothetical protein